MQTATGQVFLSYRSTDLALAEEVHCRLTAAWFSVWFDRARPNRRAHCWVAWGG